MRKSVIRQLLTASLLIGAAAPYAFGQACPDAAKLTAGHSGPIAAVRYLADDLLEGRLAGSAGERCAADYIAARFRQLGLQPAGDSGSYFQRFTVPNSRNPHVETVTARNVIAVLEGADPQLKNEYIVIGAHYDHLGMGPFGSLAPDQRAIHNGADDNASGVAAMIEVAQRLTKERKPARSVVFIAFSGEEGGLFGSSYFANNPTLPITLARGMLNMDMVGRLAQGPLIVYGIGTATEWKGIVNSAAEKEQVPLTLIADGFGASDHTSFYLKDIPVLHFFSNVHADYHKPSDDWDKIDAAGLVKVAAIVTNVARDITDKQTLLTLVKGAGRAPGGAPARGSGASLGTVPDFTPVAKGVKLSGVRAGSPAHKAGLLAGDIIIRFDNDEIADLQGMTNALNARKPGDAVRVTVLRDGKELSFDATLGRRGQ